MLKSNAIAEGKPNANFGSKFPALLTPKKS